MAQNQKSYDNEFKAQAVKLAQEIGGHHSFHDLQSVLKFRDKITSQSATQGSILRCSAVIPAHKNGIMILSAFKK